VWILNHSRAGDKQSLGVPCSRGSEEGRKVSLWEPKRRRRGQTRGGKATEVKTMGKETIPGKLLPALTVCMSVSAHASFHRQANERELHRVTTGTLKEETVLRPEAAIPRRSGRDG